MLRFRAQPVGKDYRILSKGVRREHPSGARSAVFERIVSSDHILNCTLEAPGAFVHCPLGNLR